jgi:hypothetical protein
LNASVGSCDLIELNSIVASCDLHRVACYLAILQRC